jgi:hypothetical protein
MCFWIKTLKRKKIRKIYRKIEKKSSTRYKGSIPVTFVANLKKKKTPPPPSHFEGWRPFWELHIFRFQSVVFCVEFSGNQIFRKSPQNFSSSGVALRRKVCTPPPLPPVYNLKFLGLKLTKSQVSANERLRATSFHLTSNNSQRPI